MISKNMLTYIKSSLAIKKYPTADRNAHIFRIMAQGIPYYMSRAGYSFPPLSIFIHLNTNCNLKCSFCDAGQDDPESMFYKNLKGGSNVNMPLESFKSIIDKVKFFKPFVGIPATEPSLYPDIIEAIQYITDNDLRCSIATNGTLLEGLAEDLIDANITKLIISLDGPERIHDKIRGVPGTFDKVVKGIKKIDEIKKRTGRETPYIYLNYVIAEDNYETLVEMVDTVPLDLIQQVDFRVMFFCTEDVAKMHNKSFGQMYDATSACLSGGIDLKNVDTRKLYGQIKELDRKYGAKCKFFFNHGEEGLRIYYHEPEKFLDETKCMFPWYTLQIATDGTVIPPQRCYANDFGNIIEQEFSEIWNGKKMRQFRKDLKKYGRFPACTRCEGVNY